MVGGIIESHAYGNSRIYFYVKNIELPEELECNNQMCVNICKDDKK